MLASLLFCVRSTGLLLGLIFWGAALPLVDWLDEHLPCSSDETRWWLALTGWLLAPLTLLLLAAHAGRERYRTLHSTRGSL